jgi:ribosomal protein S18 acetylase RimI-like enzyme
MTEYVLRHATPDDSDALYALTRASLGPYIVGVYGPWDDAVQTEFHRRWYDADRVWIIESADQLIGVLDYTFHEDHLDLSRITIHPDHQNRGVGTAVITDLLNEADRRGVPTMLQVFDINPALHLYERLGFVETDRDGPTINMIRHLATADQAGGGAVQLWPGCRAD